MSLICCAISDICHLCVVSRDICCLHVVSQVTFVTYVLCHRTCVTYDLYMYVCIYRHESIILQIMASAFCLYCKTVWCAVL